MYNRTAKGINAQVWQSLMEPTDWKEVKRVIDGNSPNKSAGWDGVSSDLVYNLNQHNVSERCIS